MSEPVFLTNEDLAERWGCRPSTIRNARPQDLPEPFRRPGSRLVRYALSEVEAFERAHTAPRDYDAERRLGLSRGLSGIPQTGRAGSRPHKRGHR